MKALNSTVPFLALFLILAGCSGANVTPVASPDDYTPPAISGNGAVDPGHDASPGRALWGLWQFAFNSEDGTLTALPARQMLAHYNFTPYVQPPACNDCLALQINSFNPATRILDVDVFVRNPTPLNARDVRGILFTDDYGHLLTNDDGWTAYWDIPGGQDINPFKAFAKDDPQRIFKGGEENTENYLIYIPQPPNWNKIFFAIDGSWPGNCKEPYNIDNFMMKDVLYQYVGASAGVSVDVYDWQDDVGSVGLTAPDITGVEFVDFTHGAGNTWDADLVNVLGKESGEHRVLITATSLTSPNHVLYKYVTITITETEPPAVNSVDPDSAYVDETVTDMTITGENFLAPADVVLRRDPSVISTYNVEVIDPTTITCDVDIPLIADAGLYDVMVINGDTKIGVGEDLFTVGCPEPTITDINPGTGSKGSMVHDIEITGANFVPLDISVVLKKDGEPDIPVPLVQYIDTEHIKFDLLIPPMAALGLYDVEITNGCGAAGVGAGLFEVTKLGWVRTWGGTGYDGGVGICLDPNQDILVSGWFAGTVDFDPGPGMDEHTAVDSYSYALSKFDEQGNFQWVRVWDTLGEGNTLANVRTDLLGNIWLAGSFGSTLDLDPGIGVDDHTAVGPEDIYLVKLDTQGNYIWGVSFGGTDVANAWGIAVDPIGNCWVTGRFMGTIDLNPDGGDEHTSNGDYDVFLCKFTPDGTLEWGHTWGGVEEERGYDVDIDGYGNCRVIGYFMNEVDFDPDVIDETKHTSAGKYDVFLSKFDPGGDFQWVDVWGDVEFDYGYCVTVDPIGNAWVTGWIEGTVDMDPGPGMDNHTSGDSHDAFLSKFDSSGQFQWARSWGGEDKQWGYTVNADDFGNVWVGGQFLGSADFDPSAGMAERVSNGAEDAYLSMFDAAGNFQWVHTWGAAGSDGVNSTINDILGDSYATGWFENTVDFEPGDEVDERISNGGYDVFLIKLDAHGMW